MSFRHQQGMSTIAIVVIILVAAFFGTCAVKLGPIYIESFTVKKAVENVVDEVKGKGVAAAQVKSLISRQFTANRVEAMTPRDIKVNRQDGKMILDATYEKRVPLMFNIDVVVKFDTMIYEL